MKSYELMLLIDPVIGEAAIEALLLKISDKIKSFEGEVGKTDKWGIKRLQSELKNARKAKNAFYVVIYFSANPDAPKKISNYLKVTEGLLRFSVMLAKASGEKEIEGKPIAAAEVEAPAVAVSEIKLGEPGGQS